MKTSTRLLSLFVCACLLLALPAVVTPVAMAAGATYRLSLDPDASEYTFARIPDRQVQAGAPLGNLPALSRRGYYFGGWYTGEIGEGECYTSESTMPAHNLTLYAYWYVHSPGADSAPGESSSVVPATTKGEDVITSVLTVTGADARIQMPRGDFDAVAAGSDDSVTLATPAATVTFNGAAVDAISAAAAGDLVFAVNTVDYASQSERVRSVTGGRAAYDFTLQAGDAQISSFGTGSAAVSIPYELQLGEDRNAVVVYYVDDAGDNPHVVRGSYSEASGTVNFAVAHFSQYAIGYNEVVFTDVPVSAAYRDGVTFCAARGITTGTGNGFFSPELTLTRGQFITMCMRAYGIAPDENPQDNFSDAGDDYYTGYIAAAKRLGISNGVGNNQYMPEGKLSSQDMLTLLYRTLNVLGQLPKTDTGKKLADFSDAEQVEAYAQEAVGTFVTAGVFSGNGKTLDPTGDASRAVMVQVLYALLSE